MTEYRPGCFGSPLAHVSGVPCNKCPFRAECGSQAEQRAKRLKARFGIEAAMRPWLAKGKPRPVNVGLIATVEATMPKKAKEALERWSGRGIDLKRAASLGVNPFDTQGGYMKIVFRMLFVGGFTRPELRQALTQELGWVEATASSHVGIAVGALLATGAAVERDGRIIKENVGC